MLLDCPTCNNQVRKLIGIKQGIYCQLCYRADRRTYANLHLKFPGAEAKGLTCAKADVIANRIICREDRSIVLDRRTGRETQK